MKLRFPGGKSADGTYQKLINLIPPHEAYIETHLGGGGILRKKSPATRNIGVDIDPEVIKIWSNVKAPVIEIYHQDAVEFLKSYKFTGNEFIYCDPPYLRETRKRIKKMYIHEYAREQHIELLDTIKKIPAKVMISGYESELYKSSLSGWNTYTFQAKTHKSVGIEWVWMNYPQPRELHDYKYLGKNFRERQKIKNTLKSIEARIKRLTLLERQALLKKLHKYNESDA